MPFIEELSLCNRWRRLQKATANQNAELWSPEPMNNIYNTTPATKTWSHSRRRDRKIIKPKGPGSLLWDCPRNASSVTLYFKNSFLSVFPNLLIQQGSLLVFYLSVCLLVCLGILCWFLLCCHCHCCCFIICLFVWLLFLCLHPMWLSLDSLLLPWIL